MNKRQKYLSGGLFLVPIIFLSIFDFSDLSILRPERVAAILGPYGPIGIIAGQIAQVLIAPIPPVTAIASGLLYGPFKGAIISLIGASIGSFIAIYLSNRFGRPLVEKFVSEQKMEKFDEFIHKSGYMPFIILFVLPGFPDDVLCFIGGLTNLDWKTMAFIASIGRLPGILMLTTTGYSIGQANLALFIISGLSVAIVSTLSVKYRKQIEKFTNNKIYNFRK